MGAIWVPRILPDLDDVPGYAGNAYKTLRVNSAENAIEYAALPYVDITTKGAVSGADSSTAINAAITAAASGAGRVLIPAGNFIVDATINLASGVPIYGVGNKSVLTAKAGLNSPMIQGTSVSNVEMFGFKMDGNLANQTNILADGINLNACTHVDIHNLEVTACYNHAIISTNNSSHIRVYDNYIHDTGTAQANPTRGLWFLDTSWSEMRGNHITAAYGFCATVGGGGGSAIHNTVIGNRFSSPVQYDNIIIYGTEYTSVVGNQCYLAKDSGIVFELSNHCTAVGNILRQAWYVGVYLSGAQFCTVTGNTFIDNGQAANNIYSDVTVQASGATNSIRNVVGNNTFNATLANKTKYAYEEKNSAQDYNIITSNTHVGQVTGGYLLLGANSIQASNL